MHAIVQSIRRSLEAKLWLPAVALSLAVPDICSQIEYPELAGRGSTGKRYPLWFDAWVKDRLFRIGHNGKEFPMSGNDCYAFRNAFLHVGEETLQDPHNTDYKIIKPTAGDLAHMSTTEILGKPMILFVGSQPFCNAIYDGAVAWEASIRKRRPESVSSIERLMNIVDGEVTASAEHSDGDLTVRSSIKAW
jgi:hypothetical protein